MEHSANSILLRGNLVDLPQYSHENHDRRFYRFYLEVCRLSGNRDILPVLASEQVLEHMDLSGGSMVEACGQIRSFNNRSSSGRKLVISVYADRLAACEGEFENEVRLIGTLCKPPIYRQTPLGREICDAMLAVNRPYHRSDYIPCIFWGKTAALVSDCGVGAQVELKGRLQSREYVKVLEDTSESRTAYEVSAMSAAIF